MSVKMVYGPGFWRSAITCDQCGQEIGDHDEGDCHWMESQKGPKDPCFTHKGCWETFEADFEEFRKDHGLGDWRTISLMDFMALLALSLNLVEEGDK